MHRRQRWAARYPPGPLPLPGLGNLLHVDFKNTPYCFDQLRRRFGNVFSLQLAWTPVVVLNGLAAVREALVTCGEDTADRPPVPINQVLGFGPRSQGKWRWAQRPHFRGPWVGGDRSPSWVTPDPHLPPPGRPFRPNSLLDKAVSNVIASLTYGRRFEYDDPRFLRLFDLTHEALKEESGFLREVLNAIPLLLRIPGLAGKVLRSQKAFLTQLDELLTEHRMTWDPAQPPRDLTEAFLAEMEKAKGNPESSFNEENLRMVVADLFSAGMVTTSTTLAWGLLLMILHPDVQRESSWGRVQGAREEGYRWGPVNLEIDDVIGQVRRPEMGDQARMPYTTAVIHEVQRFGDIVPLGVTHMTSRDIELQGFLIPKVVCVPRVFGGRGTNILEPSPHSHPGTTLFTNLSSVLKDEAVWEKPFRFHPEHFLDAQGHFVKPEAFLPFSAGRRACLGEPLARMELFLFFTCLLQRFSFSVPAGQPRPSHHGVFAFLVTPSPYELCAVPR
uniref:Cytochrome P450 n=1 Tax=Macaca nemestrina TaxID=9545 RepID=A0A2K6CVU4_MACNE